jgi:hypothetical protein
MTPKEKAEQLVDKYLEVLPSRNSIMYIADVETAQKCAIIAVDLAMENDNDDFFNRYLLQVKQEIEKL